MPDEPGLSAAMDQLGKAANEWAAHLASYRLQLMCLGFTTETAEALTLQLDERLAFLAHSIPEE